MADQTPSQELPRGPTSDASQILQSAAPPHSKTESTLAPTAEFTRIFLLAWIIRYIARGSLSEIFDPRTFDFIKKPVNRFIDWVALNPMIGKFNKLLNEEAKLIGTVQKDVHGIENEGHVGHAIYTKLRPLIRRWRGNGSDIIPGIVKNATRSPVTGALELGKDSIGVLRNMIRSGLDDIGYALTLGFGSSYLSWRYSRLVRQDIINIFRETVGYEKNIPQEQVTFDDIRNSNNAIVRRTVENYRSKLWERWSTDALFFVAAPLRSLNITDLLLGVKGVQIFADTWQRKTTMFEDLVTFINNKINPRNGLGQPIGVGEIFDLYQHYTEQFQPDVMFRNVIARNAVEDDAWSKSQPIFQRMADLMNNSYAYKHKTVIDESTGKPKQPEDFALPKFIYLLGHNLIKPGQPQQTLATIEIANRYGIPAVKDMQAMFGAGANLDAVLARYPVPAAAITVGKPAEGPNAVLPKGSTMQPERAPSAKIQTSSILSEKMLAGSPQAQLAAT